MLFRSQLKSLLSSKVFFSIVFHGHHSSNKLSTPRPLNTFKRKLHISRPLSIGVIISKTVVIFVFDLVNDVSLFRPITKFRNTIIQIIGIDLSILRLFQLFERNLGPGFFNHD